MTDQAPSARCRLHLHDWDPRENPETHEWYEVCLRCDAYRDRGQTASGAGVASASLANLGGLGS